MFADALYVGDASVERVYVGDLEVWSADPSGPTLPVVTITGTETNVARDQFRQACVDYGTTFDTVKVLPFRLGTSTATDMRNMFSGCSALTSVPDLDTSQVTDMRFMFRGCFALTDGNVRLIGRHPNVRISAMIENSGLTREPFYDANGDPI